MKTRVNEELKITEVSSREILDSRGNPTIEVEIYTKCGCGIASVPSGASTGIHEAWELRDGDKSRYGGKGTQMALRNIKKIIKPRILGMDVTQQTIIDELMIKLDGTKNKSKLGANTILGVSLAIAKAAADSVRVPLFKYLGGEEAESLPVPMMNVINGGLHAGNKLKIQEFMILPIGAKTFSQALRMGTEVYHTLRKILRKKYGPSATNLGDEGGYAPPMRKTVEALEMLLHAIHKTGYSPRKDFYLGLDAAASNFYNVKKNNYLLDNKYYTTQSLIDFYKDLIEEYPLFSIEDPLQEEDFQGFTAITKKLGNKVLIVGDDLFVTNIERIKKGIKEGAGNALLLKVNQIGTLSESLNAARFAQKHNYKIIVSHRSGETTDNYISDIAVALNAGLIKTGAPARGERTAKYNRLLKIETELGKKATYAGIKNLSYTLNETLFKPA